MTAAMMSVATARTSISGLMKRPYGPELDGLHEVADSCYPSLSSAERTRPRASLPYIAGCLRCSNIRA